MFRNRNEAPAKKRPEKRPIMGISREPDRAKVQNQRGSEEEVLYYDNEPCASSEYEPENLDRAFCDSVRCIPRFEHQSFPRSVEVTATILQVVYILHDKILLF